MQVSVRWAKNESLWEGFSYIKGVEGRKGSIYWLRKCKTNPDTGKNYEYGDWPEISGEVAETVVYLLVLKTIKCWPWVCAQQNREESYLGWPECFFYISS